MADRSIARYRSFAVCPVSRSFSAAAVRPSARPRVPPPSRSTRWVSHSERVRVTSPVSGSMRSAGAAAELIHPGRLDWLLLLVQARELLIGVGGEGAGGGAVRDPVASCRGGGRHQVIADGLAEPGPQPGGQPGPVLDGGQRLGESPLLTAGCAAAPPGLGPVQQDPPVPGEHVAGPGPGMLLDPGGCLAAPRAAPRGLRGGVGDYLDQGLPVPGHGHRGDQQPGDPQQDRRRGAARRAARRGLRGHGGAGNVQRWRFLLRICVSWSKRESRGNRFLSASYCNSQANSWICGRARNPPARNVTERETRSETGRWIFGEAFRVPAAEKGNWTGKPAPLSGAAKGTGYGTPAGEEGSWPRKVTEGNREAGDGQGAVGGRRPAQPGWKQGRDRWRPG